MTQKRTTILNRVVDRLYNEVTGLRNTSSDYWNIGSGSNRPKCIWRSINIMDFFPEQFPTIVVLADTARVSKPKPRHYVKTLPVDIIVWDKAKSQGSEEIIEYGEKILERLIQAIELDERFKAIEEDGTLTRGTEILMDKGYDIVSEGISEVGNGIVFVNVEYEFTYVESFLGIRSK